MASRTTIPIQPLTTPGSDPPAAARTACGGCAPDTGAATAPCPGPLGQVGLACAATQLSGTPAQLQRLLAALGASLGFAPDAPELGGVHSLRIGDGEVELQLLLPPAHCGASARAEAAFDTLRALLPDTDIYVLPVRTINP